MAAYLIVDIEEVFDKVKYGEYVKTVPATVEKYGGKYLVRGGRVTVAAGDWNPTRLIIVEFESIDKFNVWWHSPEYRSVAHLREQSARTKAIVVEGV
ncbi:MAG: DUF1330 domain-containing protein [Candidatus Omnitrophota bacterium]